MKKHFTLMAALVMIGLTLQAKESRECSMKSNKSLWAQTNPKSYSSKLGQKGASGSTKTITRTAKGVQ
jgi:hypothetical protein